MTSALGAKPVVDTSEFKQKLSEMNADLRNLESGFRANTASMGDWSKSGSGLEERIKSLNSQMEVQRDKVALLRARYEEVKEAKGADARETKNAENEYLKATATLGRMEYELGTTTEALDSMGAETVEATDKAERSSKAWDAFGTAVKGAGEAAQIGLQAIAGLAAGAAAAVGALATLTLKAGESAGELVDLSVKTGISTTRLQELTYAGAQLGFSLEAVTSAQYKLVRAMNSAAEGKGAQAEAFEALGVSAVDASGKLRDSQIVFDEVVDALGKIESPTEADALAMTLFGKSAQELNPVIRAGSEEIARLSDEAHEMGAVMSEENVAALEEFDDKVQSLKMSGQGLLRSVATAFLPAFGGIVDGARGYMAEIVDVIGTADGDSDKMVSGLTGIFDRILQDVSQQLPKWLKMGLDVIQGIIKGIVTALPGMLPAAIETLLALIDFITANLPMIADAAVQIVIALTEGLANAAPELIPAIVLLIGAIVQIIIDHAPELLRAGWDLINGIAAGIVAAIPQSAKDSVERFLTEIGVRVALGLARAVRWGKDLLTSIRDGFVNNVKQLAQLGKNIYDTISGAVDALWGNILKIGSWIVQGVWEGIEAARDWFYDLIYDFFSGIVASVLDILGISSPSKVFAEIGKFTMQGFAQGFEREFADVQKKLERSFGGLGIKLQPALAGGGAGFGGMNQSNNIGPFFAPVIFQGPQTPESLGEAIRTRRF